jgi:hypothetical protein
MNIEKLIQKLEKHYWHHNVAVKLMPIEVIENC